MEEKRKNQSLRKTALSGMFWTLTQQFGTQGIQFLVSIVLARLLLPAEFGLIGMITVFYAVGNSLMDAGLTQSLIRSKDSSQKDYSTVFFFNLAGSILIYLIIYFSAPFIADFYKQSSLTSITRVYCLSFLINAFSSVQMTKLTKEMKFKKQMIIALPSLVLSSALGIWLAYHGYGVWSLVWMSLLQAFLNSVQLWIYSKWIPSLVFDFGIFKSHFKFGYKLTLSGLLDTIFTNIYQIIIGRYFLASQVGYYTRASTLRQLPVMNLSKALNKVTYPLFATIQDDDARLKSVYKQIMQMVLFVIVPALILMNVLAEPLFRFLFTEKWLPAVPYFQIMAITGLLYPIHAYNLNILKVKGRSDLFLKLEVIKKVLVVLMILFTLRFGIIGLLWGQLVNSIISFFINTYYTGKFLHYTSFQQVKDLLPTILLGFLMGAIVWGIDYLMVSQGWADFPRLLIGGLAGLAIYLSAARVFQMESFNNAKKIIFKR